MANGFNGVSQAQALIAIRRERFDLKGGLFQKAQDNSWNCFAEKDMAMFMVVVDQVGVLHATLLS
jgi:hypothetical protein